MLRFVLQKMRNKFWMVAALLIGSVLLISMTAVNPLYTEASLQRMLTNTFSDYVETNNRYPFIIRLSASTGYTGGNLNMGLEDTARKVADSYGLPLREQFTLFTLSGDRFKSSLDRRGMSWSNTPGAMDQLRDHIRLIEGSSMSPEVDAEGVADVVISRGAMVKQKLLLGEVLTYSNYTWADGRPLKLRIAGVFTNAETEDPYWVTPPDAYTDVVFMDAELFRREFLSDDAEQRSFGITASWYILPDHSALRQQRVGEVLAVTSRWSEQLSGARGISFETNFVPALSEYQKVGSRLRVTLLVLQVPIFVLLAAFILMVAGRMFEMEQLEISVLRSRGAGRGQIIGIYLIQSLLTSGLGVLLGLPLALFLVQVLGSTASFLEFVGRRALPVRISLTTVAYVAAAFIFSVLAMVLPAITRSRESVVSHEHKRAGRGRGGQRALALLMAAALGVGFYGLYSYNNQREILAARVVEGISPDPLLYLSSSLFLLGAGLLVLLLFPWLVRGLYRIFGGILRPAWYTAFLRMQRSTDYRSMMLFLIMTLAIGLFDASAARTINTNSEQNIRYVNGADLVVQEKWWDNSAEGVDPADVVYIEPDFGRYRGLPGVESATRVLVNNNVKIYLSGGASLDRVTLMGIHTREFGETAYFDESLIRPHWYNYLNTLAESASAVLLSSNFRDDYGFKLGQGFYYRNSAGLAVYGVVAGFIDYWPAYSPTVYAKGSDGLWSEKQNYLIVANLAQVQAAWGVTPYQVWMKTGGANEAVYDLAQQEGLTFQTFKDTAADIIDSRNDPLIQGTNGMLTVGFIAALVLCATGFLIYWILSIRERELQFGILRAMGMTMGEVGSMLAAEHLFMSGVPIAAGAAVGLVTSRLYMPLIQLAYAASDNAVPLRVVMEGTDILRLGIVVGGMVLICLVVLAVMIRRLKIAQALKLGD